MVDYFAPAPRHAAQIFYEPGPVCEWYLAQAIDPLADYGLVVASKKEVDIVSGRIYNISAWCYLGIKPIPSAAPIMV